jgi:hypothetical protein
MDSIPENTEQLLKLLRDTAVRDGDAGRRFRLNNGQLARLSFKRERDNEYPHAVVSLDPPPTEQAIIAALVALYGKRVEEKNLRRVDRALLGAHWYEQALEALAKGEPLPDDPPGADNVTPDDTLDGFRYLYVEDLLRHYRPDFDNIPRWDQVALVTRVLEKTNEYLNALRALVLCVQHGHPYEGIPNTPVKEAARDVRAAELRDIEGLSYAEIGKRVDVGQTPSDKSKGDNTRVRTRVVPKGRAYFKQALGGEEGYWEYVNSRKAERKRRLSLEEDSRAIEDNAEILKLPIERMRHIMTCTWEELNKEIQALDHKHPDDQRIFLAIVFGRAWREFFGSR